MEDVAALDRYRRYLVPLDEEASTLSGEEDEYIDLLTPGAVVDLLCTRDELAEAPLSTEQEDQLARLGDLLVKHGAVIVEILPPLPNKPRGYWWWHLQGRWPLQFREAARRLSCRRSGPAI